MNKSLGRYSLLQHIIYVARTRVVSSPSEVLVKVVHGDMHTLCGDIGQLGLSLPDELGLAPALSPFLCRLFIFQKVIIITI